MAQFIAYLWDDQSVRAISASANGADISIHALVEQRRETPTDELTAETALENAVSSALERVGAERGQTTAFAIRRSQAEIRTLAFPDVPDEDLPSMVRIQASQVLNSGSDGLLDFTPIGKLPDGQRFITLTALDHDTQIEIISSAAAAGVTIGNMTLHPLGTADYINKHLPSPDPRLIIDLLGIEAELTVARDGVAELVRTIRISPDTPDVSYIVSEVRRTMTAYQNQPNGDAIAQIVVVGTDHLHEQIADALSTLDVDSLHTFDPFQHVLLDKSVRENLPQSTSSFLGLIGLANQLIHGVTPSIDLLHPTQPPKQTEKRDKAVRTGLYAALAVAVVTTLLALPIANLHRSISETRPAESLQQKASDRFEKYSSAVESITTYESSAISWLDELTLLSDTLPSDPNDVIVDGFSGRSDNSRIRDTDSPLGTIFLDMHLKDASVFEQLPTSLDNGSHLVESKGLTPDTTENGLYTRRTQQTITIHNSTSDPNAKESNRDEVREPIEPPPPSQQPPSTDGDADNSDETEANNQNVTATTATTEGKA